MNLREIVAKYPTPEDFTRAVEEQLLLLAKEQPDFRYNTSGRRVTCRYNGTARMIMDTHPYQEVDAGPECKGCVFGQALQNLGWDNITQMDTPQSIKSLFLYTENIIVPAYWSEIQNKQDAGATWSEAVSLLSANTPVAGE